MNTNHQTQPQSMAPITNLQLDSALSEFAGDAFVDPDGRLPRLQAVRGENPDHFGFFLTFQEMAKAGWGDFGQGNIIDYSFQSGKKENGLLIQNPRILVCPKSPVLAFDRVQSKAANTTVVVGLYGKAEKEDEKMSTIQYYNVILLDSANLPLHQVPLALRLKGSTQASFSLNWQAFCEEFNACFSMANRHLGVSPKPKNLAFYSLVVFEPKLAREIVGSAIKSPALRVVGYEKPTLETWQKFFVGTNPEAKQFVWQSLAPNEPLKTFGQPALPPALPPAPMQPSQPLRLISTPPVQRLAPSDDMPF